MGVIEIIIDTSAILVGVVCRGVLEGVVENATSVVTIFGARPEIHLPAHGPTSSFVTTKGESIDRRLEVIVATLHLVEGIEAHEVAHVAVSLVA